MCTRVIVVGIVLVIVNSVQALEPLINQGTRDWVQAARTGRADILCLGDSVVWNEGWTKAMEYGSYQMLELAGTGLMPPGARTSGDEWQAYGYSWCDGRKTGTDWTEGSAVVSPELQGYVWRQEVLTAGSHPLGWDPVGIIVRSDRPTLQPQDAYDLKVWHAPTSDSCSMMAVRYAVNQNNIVETVGPATAPRTSGGLQETVFSFRSRNDLPGTEHRFFLTNVKDTSLFYARLVKPNATGTTVSSWRLSGSTTQEFLNQVWLGSGMTQAGRAQMLSSIVSGGSGRLNVMIYEGINDSNYVYENTPSCSGLLPGYSKEAFRDNVQTLINQVRADWAAAGLAQKNLCFTVVGMYEPILEASRLELMREYAQDLRNLSAGDTQVSFLDAYEFSPFGTEALAMGYLKTDGIHLTEAGALYYGPRMMQLLCGVVTGDVNKDGVVNVIDLGVLASNYRQSGNVTWGDGDFNFDGKVNVVDLGLLAENYITRSGGQIPVPEPSALFLGTLGCLMFRKWFSR